MDIIRSWREQKVMLKRRFPVLRDEDFAFESGQKESMLDKLCVKLNMTRDEINRIFAELQLY